MVHCKDSANLARSGLSLFINGGGGPEMNRMAQMYLSTLQQALEIISFDQRT